MDDIVALPNQRSIPVLLVCAGNRRKEQNLNRASIGFNWGAAGCSTAVWTGVPLWYLLELSGYSLNPKISKVGLKKMKHLHLHFEGVEKIGNKGIYGTSVPLLMALDPAQDMMIAYKMNNELLPPDHGYPLRIILPGYIGGRMVKWLAKITVKSHESDNYWHINDNRVLPPPVLSREIAAAGDWWSKPEYVINHLNINSTITSPAHGETLPVPKDDSDEEYVCKGYAYNGGGRPIKRIEVSIDHGKTWMMATMHSSEKTPLTEYGKQWCWTFWSCPVSLKELVKKGLSSTEVTLVVRAWDDSQNTQPEYIIWNLMGMMNNHWFRVYGKIDNAKNHIQFQHPTNHDITEEQKLEIPGWMSTNFELPWMEPGGTKKASAQRKEVKVRLTQHETTALLAHAFSMEEVAKHNSKDDCWIVVDDFVYDCTKFLDVHPGGATSILIHAGKNATKEFHDIHSSESSYKQLFSFCIGKVAREGTATASRKGAVATKPKRNVSKPRWNVVVVGNGMVGQRFCEKLRKYDRENNYHITCVGEESRRHYNRMRLTEYFEHRNERKLYLAEDSWYEDEGVTVHLNRQVRSIDHDSKRVIMADSEQTPMSYDYLVMATGSYAFVPPVPGHKHHGVLVYRTLQDLEDILAFIEDDFGESRRTRSSSRMAINGSCNKNDKRSSRPVTSAAVLGGGLLGLEAAKALMEQGLTVYVVETAPRLMCRQLDDDGAEILQRKVEELGIKCMLGKRCKEIVGDSKGRVTGLSFGEGEDLLDVQLVILATGVRPRDDVARISGFEVQEAHKGGGIIVDDYLATNLPDIYAIGECVNHNDRLYGLVAPGYHMADILAWRMIYSNSQIQMNEEVKEKTFTGSDMSTRLKLLGVDVAVFGDFCPSEDDNEVVQLIYKNNMEGIYKKLYFSKDAKHLTGGILVGDASDYTQLLSLVQSKAPLTIPPSEVLMGKRSSADDVPISEDAVVCFCNNVTKREIKEAIEEKGICDIENLKACTKAGTGCGGCVPTVKSVLQTTWQGVH
eukprot:CFRG4045T1